MLPNTEIIVKLQSTFHFVKQQLILNIFWIFLINNKMNYEKCKTVWYTIIKIVLLILYWIIWHFGKIVND